MTRVLLEAKGVTKQIGGLTALKGVDLAVHEDEILGLVGPNGAGKTTLLNIISGIVPATAGTVTFMGEVITGLPPHAICRKGISQTFQLALSFPNLTALESVTASAIFGNHEKKKLADASHEAENHLEFVGFPLEKSETPVRNLNVVELKRVQLARALASRPALLLMDELTTGLNPTESNEAVGLIREIRKQGISILIIEHVMRVIMGVSDRIVVLDRGEKIAEGRPYEVANNQRVIDTYLGDMDAF
ncbi:MAG: ABC transporter ATP-binding protein [Methanomicrobiales archaeon]|nr:ABC transporter ATP-binding protein [Methanomicrobiales archaeon]